MIDSVSVDHALLSLQKRNFDENALPAKQVAELLAAIDSIRPQLEASNHRRKLVKGGLYVRPVIDKHPSLMDLLICSSTFAVFSGCSGSDWRCRGQP